MIMHGWGQAGERGAGQPAGRIIVILVADSCALLVVVG